MEEKELSPELTPNEIRGVDIIVKSLMKKYNFIQGWEPVMDYRLYYNTLFINLKIDYDKVSDYFGMRIRPNIKRWLDAKDPDWYGKDVYSLTALLDAPTDYTGGYDTKKKMNNLIDNVYKELPPRLQRTYTYSFLDKEQDLPVILMVHSFLVY
jgi:hypothetical protein